MNLAEAQDYLIDCCDKCCGYFPVLKTTIGGYELTCCNCGRGVDLKGLSETDIYKGVINWNKMTREGEGK